MNKCSSMFGAMTVLAACATAAPANAAASARIAGTAADVVAELRGQGYDVQLNGQPNGGLARCTVTGVHPTTWHSMQPGVVYVDVDCPGDD